MKRLFVLVCFLLWPPFALALSPYIQANKVPGADLKSVMTAVEVKLQAEGFNVVGRHTPGGVPGHGVVVVTDKGLLDAIRNMGGMAIIGAGIRVGVKSDGTVTYINPEYWYRAYYRKDYSKAESAAKAVLEKLGKALGAGKGFGGDVDAADLLSYRYMIGMERFDSDKNELKTHASFEVAVKTVQDNLAKGVAHTGKVYEVIMADKKIAVFGVAMNDAKHGEGWWVKKVGSDHIAALPWEIVIVNGKVSALYGRYRTALGWPTLGMGTFMSISDHPDTTAEMLTAVAGGKWEKFSAF
ncbi:MAG: hypothetical protein AABY73_03040 [Pseudomonadota bacterium]